MLVEWLLGIVAAVVGWIADLFGVWVPPAELTGAAEGMRSVLSQFSTVGVWINWPILNGCVAVALATWAAVLGLKLVRAIAAHFPGFGGSGD